MSEQLFERTSLYTTWGIASLSPLVDCFVYNIHQPLMRIRHVLWRRIVDLFLHHSTNVAISQIKVWAVGRPRVRNSELLSFTFTTKQLRCLTRTMSRYTVLLRDLNCINDASDGWQ